MRQERLNGAGWPDRLKKSAMLINTEITSAFRVTSDATKKVEKLKEVKD